MTLILSTWITEAVKAKLLAELGDESCGEGVAVVGGIQGDCGDGAVDREVHELGRHHARPE